MPRCSAGINVFGGTPWQVALGAEQGIQTLAPKGTPLPVPRCQVNLGKPDTNPPKPRPGSPEKRVISKEQDKPCIRLEDTEGHKSP